MISPRHEQSERNERRLLAIGSYDDGKQTAQSQSGAPVRSSRQRTRRPGEFHKECAGERQACERNRAAQKLGQEALDHGKDRATGTGSRQTSQQIAVQRPHTGKQRGGKDRGQRECARRGGDRHRIGDVGPPQPGHGLYPAEQVGPAHSEVGLLIERDLARIRLDIIWADLVGKGMRLQPIAVRQVREGVIGAVEAPKTPDAHQDGRTGDD